MPQSLKAPTLRACGVGPSLPLDWRRDHGRDIHPAGLPGQPAALPEHPDPRLRGGAHPRGWVSTPDTDAQGAEVRHLALRWRVWLIDALGDHQSGLSQALDQKLLVLEPAHGIDVQ